MTNTPSNSNSCFYPVCHEPTFKYEDVYPQKNCNRLLTRQAKTPEEVAIFNETKKTTEFVKRTTQVKLDPAIKGFSDLVSGLFENDQWVFICSQHVVARFSDEDELKRHFENEAHKQSKFGKSQSTYD